MTDVINFFQAFFILRNSAPFRVSTQEINLALSLKRDARKFAAKAADEMQNGTTAQALAFEGKDQEKNYVFAKIAIWHYNRAAETYRQAANSFDEAGRVQIKKAKAFNLINKEMTNRAGQAETAVTFLMSEFITQH